MLLNKEFTMDYKDGALHGKILKKIRDIRQPYYVGKDQTIYVQWGGQWEPYHEVVELDKRLKVD